MGAIKRKNHIDISGQQFGLLKAIKFLRSENASIWLFECKCGKPVERARGQVNRVLKRGYVPSCGCHQITQIVKDNKKICSRCREIKEITCFVRCSENVCGYYASCKSCQKKWRQDNKDIIIALRKKYQKENAEEIKRKARERARLDKEGMLKRCKKWREKHPEKKKAAALAWAKRNPEYVNFKEAKRRSHYKKAIPSWADLDKIKLVYKEARALKLHVDHIVPLVSKVVCGLHCEANLQMLTPFDNFSKNNRHWPNQ